MSRFLVMYRRPADPEAFEQAYRTTHLPLVAATPGLRRLEVARVERTVYGEPEFDLMATLFFDDAAGRRAAMKSPEWAEAGRNLAAIGGLELATMLYLDDAEVVEPTRSGRQEP